MYESKSNRISRLEEHRAIADQKKEYCSCDCHRETLADYDVISNEKAERIQKGVKLFTYSIERSKRGDFVDARKDTEV